MKFIKQFIFLALIVIVSVACIEQVAEEPAVAEPEPAVETEAEEVAPEAEEAVAEEPEPEPAAPVDLLAEIQARGVVRVSTDANYAPQSFLNEDGEFIGFDVDVATEIANRLGVEVEFVTPDWDLITSGNWGDQWDMSVGSMTVTTARQEVLDFASPAYYYTPAQFAATSDAGIADLAAIDGQTVCVGLSTTYESWLNGEDLGLPEASFFADVPGDVTVLPLQTDNECAQSIQAGREEFSVFLTSNTVVEAAIAEGVPVVKVGPPVFSENLAVAFDRASSLDGSSLVAEVGAIIAAMHEDGTMSRLSNEWFEEDLTMDPTMVEPEAMAETLEADGLWAEILDRGVVRVSTDANYAPQSFLNEDGEFVGFDVDVATEIANRLGVEVEFVTPDWDLITAGNWGDQWDMSVGSMTVTTARQEVLDFASPAYYYTPAQFAASTASGIADLAEVDGQTVCVGLSTTYESWLNGEDLGLPEASFFAAVPGDVTVLPLQTDNECAQSIQAGREEFAVFLTSNTVVEAAIAEGVPVAKVGSPVFSENLAVAFDRASSADPSSFVAAVGQIIQEMHADGTMSVLSNEWFGEDLTQDPTQ